MQLMPIGRFSRLTGVGVKALRHYDEIGLLVPAAVDDETGYRFYSGEQVQTAEAIRALAQARHAARGDSLCAHGRKPRGVARGRSSRTSVGSRLATPRCGRRAAGCNGSSTEGRHSWG
jgi:MerR family regulatory protein